MIREKLQNILKNEELIWILPWLYTFSDVILYFFSSLTDFDFFSATSLIEFVSILLFLLVIWAYMKKNMKAVIAITALILIKSVIFSLSIVLSYLNYGFPKGTEPFIYGYFICYLIVLLAYIFWVLINKKIKLHNHITATAIICSMIFDLIATCMSISDFHYITAIQNVMC